MFTWAMVHAANDAAHPDGMPYAWKITRDRGYELWAAACPDDPDGGGRSEVGTAGPGRSTAAALAGLESPEAVVWRAYDDGSVDDVALDWPDGDRSREPELVAGAVEEGHPDYGLVYEGVIFVEPDAEQDWLHAPIDDFISADSGYADIRYRDADGVWQSL